MTVVLVRREREKERRRQGKGGKEIRCSISTH